jgi:hypothetical protein
VTAAKSISEAYICAITKVRRGVDELLVAGLLEGN